ncbi:MAG: FecR domain-containing protein [Bacteroidota bacterium]
MKEYQKNEEFIYELIIDDLDETISTADSLILQEWRNADDENEKTYQDFLDVQKSIDKLYGAHGNADASWNSLSDKLTTKTEEVPVKIRKFDFGFVAKIAAVFLVLLSVGYYFLNRDKYALVATPENATTARIVLPDQTIVNMNAGTEIKYDRNNFVSNRTLEVLKGEVFIQVVKHEGAQFKVVAGDVEAQDIGTSFNVSKTGSNVSVVVEEGIVALKRNGSEKQLLLTAGKVGMYNSANNELVMAANSDPNYKAWINKDFTFEEMPLQKVAAQLEKAYQVPVIVKGTSLNNRKFTVANLHYQTIDSALAVISASLQFKVIKDKGTYVLSDN